jgi:hypothetical protein
MASSSSDQIITKLAAISTGWPGRSVLLARYISLVGISCRPFASPGLPPAVGGVAAYA